MKRQTASRWRPFSLRVGCSVAVAVTASFLAMSALPQLAFVDELTEVTATVMAIEPSTRVVWLRTEEGRELAVEAGPAVERFDEIAVGDTVNVSYYEALAAEITTAPAGAEAMVVDAGRAPISEEPGAAVGLVYTAIVTIDHVDTATNTVTFTGPAGEPREVAVKRREMQEFIAGLSDGDRVQVTHGEALAVSLTHTD